VADLVRVHLQIRVLWSSSIDWGAYDCMTFSNLTNTGTIAFEVDGTGPCVDQDKITVTGNITLGNITITTSLAVGATKYTVLEATGTITGSGYPKAIMLGAMKFANLRIDNAASPKTLKMTIESSAVLPIELTQFNATTEGSKNHLTWRTESEKNNSHFDIERSTDGTTFHSIGQVKGNNKPSSYQFVDNQPFATSYYRLRQIDFDGTETYSKIVSVELKGKGKGLKVYPNPVSNVLTVEYTEGSDFQILNLLGQQVLAGKTGGQRLDVSALPQGTYFLKVGTDVAKFIKQ
jgi:Secretion system C-terminal sorting domain